MPFALTRLVFTSQHTHTHMHTHAHAHTHTCTHTNTHMHIHTYIHTCIHTFIHTYMHAYIHAYIHTYPHTHIHADTCHAIGVDATGVHPAAQEHESCQDVPLSRRAVECCGVVLVQTVGVCPISDELERSYVLAARRALVQRGFAVQVGGALVGAQGDQKLDCLVVPAVLAARVRARVSCM